MCIYIYIYYTHVMAPSPKTSACFKTQSTSDDAVSRSAG